MLGRSERDIVKALEVSEAEYRTLLENAPAVIVTFDLKGKITSINRAVEEFGFRKDEIVGKYLLKFIPKSYWQRILKDLINVSRGEIVRGEVELNTPKGKKIAEYRSSPIRMEEKVVGIQAILRDITEKKKAEERIRASEERYRGLVELAPDSIMTFDLKGVITSCNTASSRMSGYSRDEIVGKHFAKLGVLRSRDILKYLKMLPSTIRGKVPEPFEVVYRRKDGTLAIGEVRVSLMREGGKAVGIQAIMRDVTERKRMEEALAFERDLLHALMDNIPDTIYFKDTACRFMKINRAQAKVLGIENPEEAVGKTDFDYFAESPHVRDAYMDEQTIMKNDQPLISKVELIRRADGELRWVTATKVPIKDEKGHITGLVGISRDITKLKQAEQALKRSAEILDTLHRHAIELSRAETIEDIAKLTFDAVEKCLGFNLGSFGVVEDGALHFIYFQGLKVDKIPDMPLTGLGVTVRAVRTGLTQIVSDTREDKDYVWIAKPPQALSELAVPVKVGQEVTAVINLGSMQPNAFTAEDAETLETLAKHAAYHISHVEHMEGEGRLRNIVENASDVIYTLSEEGTIMSLNPVFERITGWSRDDWVGKPFSGIIHPDDLPLAAETFQTALRGETPPPYELRILTKSGGYLIGEFTSTPLIEKGKPIGEFGIARNITERKRMEEALARERDLLQALMDNIPDTIYFKDADSRFIRINKAQAQVLGVKYPEDAIGKTDFDFFTPEHARDAYADEKEIMRTGHPLLSKVEKSERPDGYFVWHTTTKVPVRDKDGQVVGIVGISRDITDNKRMEEELRQYSERLEELVEERTRKLREAERLATIGKVASMVGHDLRNPLTGIAGAAYFFKMKLGPAMDEKLKEMLDLIEKNIEYSNNIINDLSEYSSDIRLKLNETSPESIIGEALSLVEIPNIIGVSDKSQDKPKMNVDVTRMKRVFVNLIKNAVEAMPKGGTLTIESRKTNDNVELKFFDTGVGIPEDVLEKLFTPFFTTKPKGIGLGLPICKRIVEAHEGKISVDSTVGKGTTFTVMLPTKPNNYEREKM